MSQSLHVSNPLPLSIRIVVALSLRLPYSSMGAVGVKIGIQPELPRLLHEGTMSAKAESMAWAGTPCHAWYIGAAPGGYFVVIVSRHRGEKMVLSPEVEMSLNQSLTEDLWSLHIAWSWVKTQPVFWS